MPTLLQKLSPVLTVDAIEPALDFWVQRLGFARTAEVPDGQGKLLFAILVRDGIEVMLQTRASIATDAPTLANSLSQAMLYLEVCDLRQILAAIQGCEIVIPRRRTDYGADEIGVRAPGNHIVLFAQHGTAG